jgi:hypothetical protein
LPERREGEDEPSTEEVKDGRARRTTRGMESVEVAVERAGGSEGGSSSLGLSSEVRRKTSEPTPLRGVGLTGTDASVGNAAACARKREQDKRESGKLHIGATNRLPDLIEHSVEDVGLCFDAAAILICPRVWDRHTRVRCSNGPVALARHLRPNQVQHAGLWRGFITTIDLQRRGGHFNGGTCAIQREHSRLPSFVSGAFYDNSGCRFHACGRLWLL